jgi:hypothetical protein
MHLQCLLISSAYGTQCVPNLKWHYGAIYFPLHITLNVKTIKKHERQIKVLEKCFIANERRNTPSVKAPIDETIRALDMSRPPAKNYYPNPPHTDYMT